MKRTRIFIKHQNIAVRGYKKYGRNEKERFGIREGLFLFNKKL